MYVSNAKSTYRSSSLKSKKATEKKTSKKKSDKEKKNGKGTSLFSFLGSARMIQIYGMLMMLFSLLLFISIVSYYFTYRADASCVESSSAEPANWVGTVGAHLAYFFVNFFFGIFSIGFSLLFFTSGLKLAFNKEPLPLLKTSITVILSMAWLSLLLGVFFSSQGVDFVAGAFGNFSAVFLLDKTKRIGTALILIATLFIILVLCYNFSMKSLLNLKRNNQTNSNKNTNKKSVDKEDEYKPQITDTKLSDIYMTNQNELSKEFEGKNVFHFDEDDTLESLPEEAAVSDSLRQNEKEPESVPFDVIHNVESANLSVETNDKPINNTIEDDQETDIQDEFLKLQEDYDPTKDLSLYKFPSVDLLNDYAAKEANEEMMRRELTENKNKIENTLNNFSIPIKRITATVGPTVTLYEIIPADGVRISKIKNLEDDIALSLAALGIRIIAPIPGKGTIGIEVPNKSPNIVSMKEIIVSDRFKNNKFDLPIGLGKTISNESFVVDLAKMPHLLMAGATGQGKSVGLNAIITSLLYTKHPSELKFVLVDPKKVEFTLYSVIENHYLAKLPDADEPIITDTKKVVRTLNSLCLEMDQRYDLLKLAKTRNIKEYNAKFCSRKLSPANGHRFLPYIVLIIDEFGDLIMTAGKEVEMPIARLAQLARAVGIHLIIATQRPSVNIITGTIKANFPARIAFRVSSVIDSRTILDCSGANQLIGKGDMLISTGSDLIRLQCAFVDTPEVENIAHFIEDQQAYPEPFYLPDVPEEIKSGGKEEDDVEISDEIDEMFMDAAILIVNTQQGSTSLIQRKMKLGYNRAGRIMDQLEEFGVVGPTNGSKARDVKVKTTEELRPIFQRMGLI